MTNSKKAKLRCEPLPGGGFGLASGPLTDADREAVDKFREFLARPSADEPDTTAADAGVAP